MPRPERSEGSSVPNDLMILPWASRRTGRLLAGLAALIALFIALYTAIAQVDSVLHLYDGLWMLGGAAVALALCIPLVRSWPRDRAIVLLAVATVIGSWAPLVALAIRAKMPILARLRGAMFFSNADVVGIALLVGVVCLFLALKEYREGT
ncbi:MAG TPA: hypothetical protein VLB12_12355 [Gemmatimonadales bacterium]|nr:hypothetical protein [Gemmatimonadales bacterium]